MSDAPAYWTLHVFVSGRVQGVFFRESTRREAAALGLSGWVRNLADGRVEATFTGTREQCERALAFVKMGPPAAVVMRVDEQWEAGQKPGREFEIR